MNQELLTHILKCYNLLIEGTPQGAQYASSELTPFYENPESIQYLFEICKNTNSRVRMLSSLGLYCVIKKHIGTFDLNTRRSFVVTTLNLLSSEADWSVQRSLLDNLGLMISLIEKTNPEIYEILFQRICQFDSQNDDFHLQLSLKLALKYNPKNDEEMTFYAHLIERGYKSTNPKTCFSAFELLIFPQSLCLKNPAIRSSFETFWAISISLFDVYFSDHSNLPNLTQLFIFALDNLQEKTISIEIDPHPLLSKLFSFFSSPAANSESSVVVSRVIHVLVSKYTKIIIESGAFADVIRLYSMLGMKLYNESPDDSYSLSTIPCLLLRSFIILGKNPVTIPTFLEAVSRIGSTPAGAFVSCIIFSSILETRTNNFSRYMNSASQLVIASLGSPSRLLCEAAAYTALKIISIFSGEGSDALIVALLKSCQLHPTTTLLEVLTYVFDEYKKSDIFYENALTILATIIGSPPPEGENEVPALALSALACLTINSSVAIFSHVNQISAIVTPILGSPAQNDYLKPSAISCLAQTLTQVALDFPEITHQFATYCAHNAHNPDIRISVACFRALENLIKIATSELIPIIKELLPFFLEKLLNNPIQKYIKSYTHHLSTINSNESLNNMKPNNLERVQKEKIVQKEQTLQPVQTPKTGQTTPNITNNQTVAIQQTHQMDKMEKMVNMETITKMEKMKKVKEIPKGDDIKKIDPFDDSYDFDDSDDSFDDFESAEYNILLEFEIFSLTLKILSTAAKTDWQTLIPQLGHQLLQSAEEQLRGFMLIGQEAASFAVCELSKGFALARNGIDQVKPRLESIAYNLLPEDINSELMIYAFDAASKIVEWFDYNALQFRLKHFLDQAYNYLSTAIVSDNYTLLNRRITRSVLNFLAFIIASSDEVSSHLTSNFMRLCLSFMTIESERARSIVTSYFSSLIGTSCVIEDQLKHQILVFAMHAAEVDNDSNNFQCLKAFALKEKSLAMTYGNQIIGLICQYLQKPVDIEESSLLSRDSAVSALATYIELMQGSINLNQLCDITLSALPLVFDYSDIDSLMGTFFPWFYSKVSQEHHPAFLKVLIIQFGNPKTVMMHMHLSSMTKKCLLTILREMLAKIQNPDPYCLKILDGNAFQLQCLHKVLAESNDH